jgi:hypothetical protein
MGPKISAMATVILGELCTLELGLTKGWWKGLRQGSATVMLQLLLTICLNLLIGGIKVLLSKSNTNKSVVSGNFSSYTSNSILSCIMIFEEVNSVI